MDIRRRPTTKPLPPAISTTTVGDNLKHRQPSSPKASDTLPLPLKITNGLFFALFFSVSHFLLHRWREKIRNSTPLHVISLSELAACVSLIASAIYLLGFFGVDFVQSFITRSSPESWEVVEDDKFVLEEDSRCGPCAAAIEAVDNFRAPLCTAAIHLPLPPAKMAVVDQFPPVSSTLTEEDVEIINSVVAGSTHSYSLESKLGDCRRAAAIRREALQRITGKSLAGLPLDGFNYESILGQCCEMPVGYVQIPVGIAGPLLINGVEFFVPMATTEGCLVASTNRGCKAIYGSGGATCVLLRDGMTRAPVVRFGTSKKAAELKMFLEDPMNFESLALVFNKSVLLFVLASTPMLLSVFSFMRYCFFNINCYFGFLNY